MTPIGYQVTIDAHDPHAQARFWAAALGYTLEDHDPTIRHLLAEGHATDEDVTASTPRWSGSPRSAPARRGAWTSPAPSTPS